jgi:hypothetical protein
MALRRLPRKVPPTAIPFDEFDPFNEMTFASGVSNDSDDSGPLLWTPNADDLERACTVCLGVGNPSVNGVVVPCAHCNVSGLREAQLRVATGGQRGCVPG